MSETIPTLERPRLERQQLTRLPAPHDLQPRPSTRTSAAWLSGRSFGASAAEALQQRRVFVLLPFLAIAGLIASLLTSGQPDPRALLAVAAAVPVATIWLGFSIAALRLL